MEGKRVLVTGGAGFIGSHLVERLGARNEVTVLDDLSTGSLRNLAAVPGELHVKRASILDTDVVAPAMAGQDVVYHLAAKTSVPESIAKPDAYWPRQDPTSAYAGVIAKFCTAFAAGKPIEIHGDGQQTRDFLYVGDLAEALELAGEGPVADQVLNLGSGKATSVNEVARVLSEITHTSPRMAHKRPRDGDIRHSLADIGKAREKLGFRPRTSLREGLEKTLAFFRTEGTPA